MKCYMLVIVLALFLLKEDVFAYNRVKRDYSSNSYDLDGSAITQTFRSAREISSTADEGTHTCSIWGQGAIRTYTDEFYHFTSTCNYILSRQCLGGTEDFNVEIRHGSQGNLEHIFMKIEGDMIVVANDTIKVNNKLASLPYDDKVINIQQFGVHVRFRNRKHTISLLWNYKDALLITVDAQYKGLLCGLCGPFDGSISTTYDLDFTRQCKLDTWNKACTTTFSEETGCASAQICSRISELFAVCSSAAINKKFVEMCLKDVCACKEAENCHCASFHEASQQCVHVDPLTWNTWRDIVPCTQPTCPGNQVYRDCAPACMSTCTDPNSQQQCDQCVNTCTCPKGTVLDNIRGGDTCISWMDCPCEYGGKIYNSGETLNSFCRSCTCQGGIWNCTNLNCPKVCKIEEGTHITTFDGIRYNLIGDCSYYAIVTKDWSVKIEMHPCQTAYRQTCLQRVTYIKYQNSYSINNQGIIQHNGNVMGMPLGDGEIMIFQQSSQYIQVHTKSGLTMQILISPIMQLYMSLPKSAQGTTKGLCGTFNDNADDDFLSAQGIQEYTYVAFSDSWKVNEECPSPKVNPTCVSSENENYAREQCAYIKDPTGAFSKCHSTVEFNKYYEMCKTASCNCGKIDDCVCAAMEAYVRACAAKGIIVMNWRRSICSITCPSTQVYHYNMRACNRTCEFLSKPDFTCEFQDVPVAGCGCPEGMYMNDKATCVTKSECPCYVNGLIIQGGQALSLNGMTCFCDNGVPSCPEDNGLPTSQDCQDKQFSDCTNASLCKRTCETLNKPCPDPCVPGCVCPDGLVEDSSGRCIAPSQCPCRFEGETFGSGETIKSDCNKCTCNGGQWECTDDPCPKTCLVYGDGHYITFDGKRYSFDGNCEYIFVEDQCLREIGTFQILTESVPCCENGVTCSRNIRILFEGKELILLRGGGVSEVSLGHNQCIDNSYTIHTVGLYLVLTFSNGITVIWDKRTRFSITLDPKWKNKVCGLCGNFNDDLEDDLTTKGNSLVTSFVEFGNSWKSMQHCSNTVNQTFPCDNNPYCLAWAQKRCNLINSPVFQACHKRVDPIPFYDACVQEACACDMEGKYLGFCTAVAVYAEACNKANVCIRWRTPELCPVYCDYYNTPGECSWHYQPCGTITTRTCSGHFVGKKYSAVLEGCYAKCPESAPYLDENTMKCVTLPQCTCYYDGRILQPGETTMNGCEECMCKEGVTSCQPVTTTTVASTTIFSSTSTTTISSTTSPEETTSTTLTTESTSSSTSETTSTTETTTTTETTPTTSATATTNSTKSETTPSTSTTPTSVSTTSSTTETTPTTSATATTTSTTSETTPSTSTTPTSASTTSSTTGTTQTTSATVTTTSTTSETTPSTSTTPTSVSTTSSTTETTPTTSASVTTTSITSETTSSTSTTPTSVSTTSSTTETPPTTSATATTTSTTSETTPSTSTTPTSVSTTSSTTGTTQTTSATATTTSTTSETTPSTSTTPTSASTTSSTTGTTQTTSATVTTTSTTSETTPSTSTTPTSVSTTSSTTETTPTTSASVTTTSITSETTSSTSTTPTSVSTTSSTTETPPTTSATATTTSTTSETTPSTSTTPTSVSTTSSTTGTTQTTSATATTTSTTSETTPSTSTTPTSASTTSSTTGTTQTTSATVTTTSTTSETTPSTSTTPTSVSTTSSTTETPPTTSATATTTSTTSETTPSTSTTPTSVSTTSSTTGTTQTTSATATTTSTTSETTPSTSTTPTSASTTSSTTGTTQTTSATVTTTSTTSETTPSTSTTPTSVSTTSSTTETPPTTSATATTTSTTSETTPSTSTTPTSVSTTSSTTGTTQTTSATATTTSTTSETTPSTSTTPTSASTTSSTTGTTQTTSATVTTTSTTSETTPSTSTTPTSVSTTSSTTGTTPTTSATATTTSTTSGTTSSTTGTTESTSSSTTEITSTTETTTTTTTETTSSTSTTPTSVSTTSSTTETTPTTSATATTTSTTSVETTPPTSATVTTTSTTSGTTSSTTGTIESTSSSTTVTRSTTETTTTTTTETTPTTQQLLQVCPPPLLQQGQLQQHQQPRPLPVPEQKQHRQHRQLPQLSPPPVLQQSPTVLVYGLPGLMRIRHLC
ncbi:mucin-2-like isoform X11 [Pristis pectinata]|uniref:mucin-2-like isoform X6 n=1 Tax=Pristis pectinata TaxID=685728 RepID=UPI00223E56DB|nr:mucin-2-like isoform X6 [Pristis pectinata]XP_051889501.1 mucin-2-like isoform X7 [Pristis pectinata]XP_051889505.1 mucin-2-like isoform X10 [Pristis pectinata]XP_051889506.1 mucin-2-like isoform X11 [Pristis pectinata]